MYFKVHYYRRQFLPKVSKQTLKIMKLIAIILFAACIQVSARGYSQITLSETNAPLQKVFQEIQQQSGYDFVSTYETLKEAGNVTVNVRNVSLQKALEECLKGKPLTYVIIGKTVVVRAEEKTDYNESTTISTIVSPPPPIEIHGRIVNQKGEPLQNVSVLIAGTKIGTTTNSDGRFALTAPNEKNIVLEISSVGYQTKKVSVGKQTEINVVLETDVAGLSDIVVVGYGTQKKSDLTGAVSQVNFNDIKNLPLVSVEQALQGQVSGVKVKRNSGDPSGNFGVFIRGVNSASNGGQPLYVVDGVPLAAGSLMNINPNDIKTLDVLKDASASAIYGARAANGVVMITTKMGSSMGKDIIEFSAETGVQTPIIPFQMADAFLQAEIVKESLEEEGIVPSPELSDKDWLAKNNNNWQKLATQNGLFQKHNVSLTGGNEKTQYLLSAFYSNTQGTLINSNYKSGGFRINLDREINDRFKVGVRLSGGVSGGKPAQTNGFWSVWKQVLMDMPWFPYKDKNGNYLPITTTGVQAANSFDNPIAQMETYVFNQNSNSIVGNTYLEYEITKGLKFKYLLGGEVHTERNYNFLPIYDRGAYKRLVTMVHDGQNKNTNWVWDATLSYDKDFNEGHKISLLAGYSAQRFDNRTLSVDGSGALNNQITQITGQPIVTSSGGINESGILSYFARAFYSYENKYLMTATVRRDGSSNFSPNRKWGNFPSVSVGWRMSEEPFMKNIGFISSLKWRVSYGLTGNQDIPSFRYVPLMSANNYAFGNALASGFAVNNPANPNLQWESLKQFDAGLDISFLQRRVNATFDYYIKRSENLLTNSILPPTAGYSGTLTKNIGTIENRGFETEITTINTTGLIKWTTNLNFSFLKNTVIDLGVDINGNPLKYQGVKIYQSYANLTTQGHPIASFYGYVFDGIWQLGEEAKATAAGPTVKPGDIKYRDLNGDGKFTAEDMTFIGSPMPTFYGGINNTVTYKSFTISVFADFATGAKVLNTPRMLGESTFWYQGSMAYMKDRWTPTNPSNTLHRASMSTAIYNSWVSTHFVDNADFLRINNLTLTYSVPKSLSDRLRVQALRLSLIGDNLHTFTSYRGYDVEASTGSSKNDPLSAGLDMGTYPLSRMYSLKINITF